MPAQTNFNVSPYFDDFDTQKNFHRVLFKPGFPVQARELTQSQSILQDQIEKLGSRILKDGDNVVPGEMALIVPASYVRLSSITQGASASDFIGYNVKGVSSGVEAEVITATSATDDDDITLFVVYKSSGNSAESKTFQEGEVLESNHPNLYTGFVGVDTISRPIDTPPMGTGSLFKVTGGSYYVNGFIVRNDEQIITLDKYDTRPTYEIGFLVTESFVTSVEDQSLLDNAQGASNFAAPGADRFKIVLTLHKREWGETDPNFILLCTTQTGNILRGADRTVKWQWLYDILAQRTFDESGNYIVHDFEIKPMEYWNSEEVEGVWDPDEDGLYRPVPGSGNTERMTIDEADQYYALKISAGKAYVQGYEVGNQQPFYLYGTKPRSTELYSNSTIAIQPGYNVILTDLYGSPDFQNIQSSVNLEAFKDVITYRNFSDGFVGASEDGNGRPLNAGNSPWRTVHLVCDADVSTTGLTEVYREKNSVVIQTNDDIVRGDTVGGANVLISTVVNPVPSGVVKPRYLNPINRVDNFDGTYGYNSTYSMGILRSTYFTELGNFPVTNGDSPWVIGDLVVGESSEAVGVVEEGGGEGVLLVSNVVGEFEAGEEIIQGDKVSRLYREGEVFGFDFYDKGTGDSTLDLSGETAIKITAIGAELEMTVADGEIEVAADKITLTDAGRDKLKDFPYKDGLRVTQRINYAVDTVPNGVKGYGIQPDFKLTNTLAKTKSFYSSLIDTNDFSANISVQNATDSEVIKVADSALFSGVSGRNFLTCDDLSGDAADQLVTGDVISFVDDEGNTVTRVVYFCTRSVGYGTVRNPSKIYLTVGIPGNVTGKTVERIRIRTQGQIGHTSLHRLPKKIVKSMETDNLATGINYTIYRQYIVDVSSGSKTVTLVTGKSNEQFINNPSFTTVTVSKNLDDPTDANGIEGTHRTISSIDITQEGGTKIVITMDDILPSTSALKCLVPVLVTDARARRKILNEDIEVRIPAAQSADDVMSLGLTDVIKIKKVELVDPTPGATYKDISESFGLDDGQRDNIYELSRIYRRKDFPAPDNDIIVTLDYFTHSNEGDFFSVDSYTHAEGVEYEAIPYYAPQVSDVTRYSNGFVNLRDVVDFRPVCNSDGLTPSQIVTITPGVATPDAINFIDSSTNNGNSVPSRPLVPGTVFECDLEYYVPKIDSLFVESSGAFSLASGESSYNPQQVSDRALALRLFNLNLPPYTFATKNINITKFNYRRYTMADIGKIDRQVQRVEELVTLSLLEQSAINMSVRDAVTGLDRFKNGIVVDNFSNHSRGDAALSQYKCSIDPRHNHLRPPHFTDQATLEEKNQYDEERALQGYRLNNGIVTLDYEDILFMQNPLATRFVNLQPYSVFTYEGRLELTPNVDTWQDVTRLPDLVIEDNSLFDAMQGLTNEMNSFNREWEISTVWSDWEQTGSSSGGGGGTTTRVGGVGRNNVFSEEQRAAVDAAIANVEARGGTVSTENLRNGLGPIARGGSPPLIIEEQFASWSETTFERNMTQDLFQVSTGRIENTSYGDRVVDVSLARTMRAFPVVFQAYRLKPNTRYYCFFDNIEVTDWCSPDLILPDFDDGLNRYNGLGGSTNQGFGLPLMSDDVGTLTGIFLIPNGRPPINGTRFISVDQVQYQTSGNTRSFSIGTRQLRFTSSPTNVKDLTQVEGFCEANFTASGVLLDKQETIVSTRIPEFAVSNEVVESESRTERSESPGSLTATYFDPVAQTFLVDQNNENGVFVTELDAFFRTKDPVEACEAYLVSTIGGAPTDKVLPHSRVVKSSDTTLRIVCTLTNNQSTQIAAGTTVIGQKSGATGVVKSLTNFETTSANPTKNVSNHVYYLIIDEYRGEFVPNEDIVPQTTPLNVNRFTIAEDEVRPSRLDIRNLGVGYVTPIVTFTDPELPGGTTATGSLKVGPNGEIYDVELTDAGSGYTRPPAATITETAQDENGEIITTGVGAAVDVRTKPGLEAVEMGVCTSEDATAITKFKFHAPVYLMGNTSYAFVLKSPTSVLYTTWVTKLGENQVGTNTRVTVNPHMGSMFMSQNGVLWTEDQTQDITFRIHRADFKLNEGGYCEMMNAPLTKFNLGVDPIETNSDGIDPDSDIFGENPQIIRVFHKMHGHMKDDLVAIEGVTGSPGGIPNEDINGLHTVIDVTFNYFTIKVDTPATSNSKDGGVAARATYQRPFEVATTTIGAMTPNKTTLLTKGSVTSCRGMKDYDAVNDYLRGEPLPIRPPISFYYFSPKQIAGYLNEAKYNDALHLKGQRSYGTIFTMGSTDSKVSPVLDIDRTNLTVSRNLVDNAEPGDPIYGSRTATVTLTNTWDASETPVGSALDIGGGPIVKVVDANPVTKKLKVSGKNVIQLVKNNIIGNSTFITNPVQSTTVENSLGFAPETKPNGSVYAKWISRLFTFENPCDGLELKLSCAIYNVNDIKCYYRPRNIGFDGDITNENWIPFNGTGLCNNSELVETAPIINVNPDYLINSDFIGLTWNVQDTAKFDGIAIKIVMSSINSATPPIIDDMQLVCSE